MEGIIGVILTAIMVPLLIIYFIKDSGKIVNKEINGLSIHRMSKPVLYFLMGFGLLGGILSVLAFINIEEKSSLTDIVISLVFLLFVGWVLFSLLILKNHKTIIKSNSIEVTSYSGKSTEIKWIDIKSVKFSKLKGQIILLSIQGRKCSINQFTFGIYQILAKIESNTNINLDKVYSEMFVGQN